MRIKKPHKNSKISVFGENFNIKFVTLNLSEHELGECNCMTKLIQIRPGLTKELTVKTIAHELTHAAIGISGLTELLSPAQEEAICIVNEHLLFVFTEYFKDILIPD